MQNLLWTKQPLVIDYSKATRPCDEEELWEQFVYPLGNGRLGCTAFGAPQRERIQFNQESLWVGNEDNTGGYQPFGDVYIATPSHAEYSDYRRELDIDRAIQTITYKSGGVQYKREYFASHPAQVIVLRFTANQQAALSGKISMGNVHEIPVQAAAETTLVMAGDTSNFWWWRLHLEQPKRLIASREYASDQNIDLDFEARVRVLHKGGEVKTVDNAVVFTDCDELTLLLAADTNYVADRNQGWRGAHPHAEVCARIAAAADRSFADLLEEHIADYQNIFGRTSLDLGAFPADRCRLSTPERVKAYSVDVEQGRVPVDRGLEALLYQYARYLMIGSSRAGHHGLPANLQGLWLINKRPSWRCDYHTDINLQMNYWFTDASNLTECFPPLAHWIDSIREVRKEETRRVLGVEHGWLMRSENGIFGGSTWHFQKGDSAWLCQNLWDHYAFTQDREYLQRYAYPVMKEISEFWLDHLKELPDGTLVVPEGRSPEHGPVGVDGVTYDQSLCWDLFTNTITASRELGVDAELRQALLAKRERLLGPQVGRWGQLQEWMEDIDDPEDDHRHINHLIGVYPGRQIHPRITPRLTEAAKISTIARSEYGAQHPGWSRVWKACIFARLMDGERALHELWEMIAKKIYDNLWAVHPPFQIEANFGYAAAVNEMLLQSHLPADDSHESRPVYTINLLPALPAAWADGSVNGLRARGGFELDIQWKDSKLIKADIRNISSPSGQCVVQYGDQTQALEIPRGKGKPFSV